MALMKWDPWQEIADKCVRYKRAVSWPRTKCLCPSVSVERAK